MQVVILAAGKGKRMGRLTKQVPKPMLKIKGRPLLEYKIKALPKKITEVIFIIGYCGDEIMDHFGREFDGRKIRYIFQSVLNGTGGAMHLARGILDKKFLVMMGDDLYKKSDINKLMKNSLAILAREEKEQAFNYGVFKTDSKGVMLDIIEKPKNQKSGLVNTGLYVLNNKFFDYELVPIGNGEFGLPQTLVKMARDYRVKIEKTTNWFPINNQEELEKAEKVISKFI